MKFNPCTGECTEEGVHCEGCGRSHEEIAEMRTLVAGILAFAKKMNYENIDEFADGVAGTIRYKMKEEQQNYSAGKINIGVELA